MKVSSPVPLADIHDGDQFACGVPALDDWLRRRALNNQSSGASRTFVVTDETGRVLGYYALAAGAVAHASASGAIRRNMPDPIPVLVLGRLAVDRDAQGLGIGKGLLKDAVSRTVIIARQVGVRALLVHALDEQAAAFYQAFGFQRSPIEPLMLMLRIQA